MIDRVTFTARLQVQRRGTFVAELGIGWIAMIAERAHPVAEVRGARGERPVRGAWRLHAAILELPRRAGERLLGEQDSRYSAKLALKCRVAPNSNADGDATPVPSRRRSLTS